MKRCVIVLAAAGAVWLGVGCDSAADLDCGDGVPAGEVCYFSSAITVTGFLCPESMPFGEPMADGGMICAPDEATLETFDPQDIPPSDSTAELGSQQPGEPSPVDFGGGTAVAPDETATESVGADSTAPDTAGSGSGKGQGAVNGRGRNSSNGTGAGVGQGNGTKQGTGDATEDDGPEDEAAEEAADEAADAAEEAADAAEEAAEAAAEDDD